MRILYLAHNFGGDGFTGRSLVRHLASENSLLLRVAAVSMDTADAWARSPYANEVIAAEDVTVSDYDALILEGGLSFSDGEPRIPIGTIQGFVRSGGQVLVCDVTRPVARSDRALLTELAGMTLALPEYGQGSFPRYQHDEGAWDPHTHFYSFFASEMRIEGWPKSVLTGIDHLLVEDPITLLVQGGDCLATGNTSTVVLESDVVVERGLRFPWASVQQAGLGHIAIIGAQITQDAVVDECPDNARWISALLKELAQRTRDDRRWRGDHAIANDSKRGRRLEDLLRRDEDQTLENKSSARLDVPEGRLNKKLEGAIFKTVAAFLNTDGGDLLIGVEDNGGIIGVEREYISVGPKHDRDAYERWLLTALVTSTHNKAAINLHVSIQWESIEGHDVCIVRCAGATALVFVYLAEEGKPAEARCYVRQGNATVVLGVDEVGPYKREHFRHR